MEDERRELGDILIDEEEARALKATQSKKMVLVLSAAVVLFLIVVLSIYALTRSEEKAPTAVSGAILEKSEPAPATPSEENRFQQLPLQNEEKLSSDDKFERIVREIKAKQAAAANANALPTPPPAETPAPVASAPEEKVEIKPEEPKSKPEPAKKPEATPAPKPAKAKPTPSAADTFKGVETKGTSKALPKGYYVQVGSFSKFSPSGAFAKKIEQNQLAYKTQHEVVNGKETIRVLVGPYASRSEANNALSLVKEKIEAKAFVKQVK